MRRSGFFSLGGLLARVWRPAYSLLPWALTSALLMTAGMWDYWLRGGKVEWVIVGLSAYELMIGLLEPGAAAATHPVEDALAGPETSTLPARRPTRHSLGL